MIPEAPLEQTENGLVPAGPGWFVLNAREALWRARSRRQSISFTGPDEWEADNFSPMLGVNLFRLEPGEPNSLYHWETEAEAFFIISGEALLIVEGQERPLEQWDFAFCPPKTNHVIVGAGSGPCVGLAMSSAREPAVRAVRRIHRRRGGGAVRRGPERDHAGRQRRRAVGGIAAVVIPGRLVAESVTWRRRLRRLRHECAWIPA